VINRLTLDYLSKESGMSISSLKRLFKTYLNRPPTFLIKKRIKVHLLIDGTYFSNDLCLIIYRDNDIKYTQLYRFSDKERFDEIKEDLLNLSVLGIELESITCDGHKAILKAIKSIYPDIIVQRCIIHVHRMALIWLRQNPKILASVMLKQIVATLPLVKTKNDMIHFVKSFNLWFIENKSFISEKNINIATGRWWYKHKNLRRTAIMIKQAIPNLFHFLDNDKIPKSTNGLESFFGHLKDTLSVHRGISYENRKAFILWYLHYKNQNQK
jgi:hypothetical protein